MKFSSCWSSCWEKQVYILHLSTMVNIWCKLTLCSVKQWYSCRYFLPMYFSIPTYLFAFFHAHFLIRYLHQPSAVFRSSFYRHRKHPGRVNIWFPLHIEIFAIYLGLKLDRRWGKITGEKSPLVKIKKRILAVSTKIKETWCGKVKEIHWNDYELFVEATHSISNHQRALPQRA